MRKSFELIFNIFRNIKNQMKFIKLKGVVITANHDGYCSDNENEETETYEEIYIKYTPSFSENYKFQEIYGDITNAGSKSCKISKSGLRHEWVMKNPIFDSIVDLNYYPVNYVNYDHFIELVNHNHDICVTILFFLYIVMVLFIFTYFVFL